MQNNFIYFISSAEDKSKEIIRLDSQLGLVLCGQYDDE